MSTCLQRSVPIQPNTGIVFAKLFDTYCHGKIWANCLLKPGRRMLMKRARVAWTLSRERPGLRHASKKPQVPGIYIPTEDRVDPAIPSVQT